MKREKQPGEERDRITGMLGLGFDNDDGQVRLTRGENYSLLGGSRQTHEMMQETAVKVNEGLEKRGKRLQDASREEFLDVLNETIEKMGTKRPPSDP